MDAEHQEGQPAILTSADPQPPEGTWVRDDCGLLWFNTGRYPAAWVRTDGDYPAETWAKIAGRAWGPVQLYHSPTYRP